MIYLIPLLVVLFFVGDVDRRLSEYAAAQAGSNLPVCSGRKTVTVYVLMADTSTVTDYIYIYIYRISKNYVKT
jgi:hypothetical protein